MLPQGDGLAKAIIASVAERRINSSKNLEFGEEYDDEEDEEDAEYARLAEVLLSIHQSSIITTSIRTYTTADTNSSCRRKSRRSGTPFGGRS